MDILTIAKWVVAVLFLAFFADRLAGIVASLGPGAALGLALGAALYSLGYVRGHNAHVRAVEAKKIEGAKREAQGEMW